MSVTNRQTAAQRGGLHPASLADSQLRHIEKMVEYVTRRSASGARHALDHEYWEQRIRALETTYELIVSQRQRIATLRERLARAMGDVGGVGDADPTRRTAA